MTDTPNFNRIPALDLNAGLGIENDGFIAAERLRIPNGDFGIWLLNVHPRVASMGHFDVARRIGSWRYNNMCRLPKFMEL